MERSIYRIALDMHRDASQYTLHAKRYDTARTIRATFTDGGKPFDVSGYYPILTGRNADGEALYEVCEVADNSVAYDFTAVLTQVPGLVECEIQLYNQDPKACGAVMITSARFSIIISEGVYNEDDIKAETKDAFTQLLADTTAAKGDAEAAAAEVLRRADEGEFDGAPGEKGDKGDKGDPGEPGLDGAPGKTPVSGVDYFTPEEREALLEDLQIKTGIKQSVTGTALTIRDSADCKFPTFTLDGGNGNVNISLTGKNLFNYNSVVSSIKGEGSTLNITAAGYQYDIFTGTTGTSHEVAVDSLDKLPILPAGTYTLSYTRLTDAGYMRVLKVADDGTVTALTSGTGTGTEPQWVFSFTLDTLTRITIRRSNNTAATVEKLQIEQGSVATPYEPYKNKSVTVEANGGKVDVMAQHPDLRSFHPTTLISNDQDLPMEVTYVADMKSYIDNRLAELAAALL